MRVVWTLDLILKRRKKKMVNKDNDFYPIQLWLDQSGRSKRWLSHRLEVSEGTIYRWKATGKMSPLSKMAITYLYLKDTGRTTLFDEVL